MPERRRALFSDISHTPQTHLLIQELLLHLGQLYQALLTRGGTRSLTASAPTRSQPDAHTITAKQGDIFRQPVKRKSTYGLNLLDGPITEVPPVPLIKAQELGKKVEVKALEGVQKVGEKVVLQIEGVNGGKAVLGSAKGIVGSIYAWKGREWGRSSVERSIPGLERIKWILDSECCVPCRCKLMRLSTGYSDCIFHRRGYVWSCPVDITCYPGSDRQTTIGACLI
jgi:hypothetical protein